MRKVIALVGSKQKIELVRELGADVAVDYSQKDWTEQVLKAPDGVGADVVLEAVAGDIGEDSFGLAAPFGRIVLFGARNIHEPFAPERVQQLIYKNQSVIGFNLVLVLQGTVIAACEPRHRHQEFLRFLDRIDESVDSGLQIHLVLDNYGTHKHPEVKRWLAARPRYHVHFTPTSSSWLNQIDRWFAEIPRKRIRRGTFRSLRELIKAMQDYIQRYNRDPQPFQWAASASKIIRKVNKYKETLETGD